MNREEAIQQLCRSQRGRRALEAILHWFEADGLGLDQANQVATLALLRAAWEKPGSTCDLISAATWPPPWRSNSPSPLTPRL